MPSAEAEADVYRASAYVAKLTMSVLEELFTEARSVESNQLNAFATRNLFFFTNLLEVV